MYFYLFNHCKIVKGATQCALYDLDKGRYFILPHSFSEFIEMYNGFNINKLYEEFDKNEHETLSEYLQFLKDRHLATFCENPNESFLAELKLEYRTPNRIHNALIEYNPSFDLKHLVSLLEKEGCRHVFFYSFESISVKNLVRLLSSFNDSGVVSVQILMKYSSVPLVFAYRHLAKKYSRFLKLILHHAPFDRGFLKNGQFEYHIGCITKKIKDVHSLYEINPYNFSVNIQLYTESQYFNSFFHKKMIIDASGNIKPDLFSSDFFGNIFTIKSLDIILSNSELKKYWYVRKDDIQVCKDCEYRYMCVDCRTPFISDEVWRLPTCPYNPYIATFEKKILNQPNNQPKTYSYRDLYGVSRTLNAEKS